LGIRQSQNDKRQLRPARVSQTAVQHSALTAVPSIERRPVTLARLIALTDEARHAIGAEYVTLARLPFKVGRESRSMLTRLSNSLDRRIGSAPQVNDVYIDEKDRFVHVSREHFLIDLDEDGYFLVDRGSVCGTIVAGRQVGGDRRGGRARLRDHDLIIVGSAASPYLFKFRAA
jgi:hypothetical protein